MPTAMYCGNSPESWVRGNASFDRSSGLLGFTIQLETDATNAGPKGILIASLKDSAGKTIAVAKSDTIGTGGKPPGHAAVRNFGGHTTVPAAVASRVRSIYLDAQCAGSTSRLFNVPLENLQDGVRIAVTVAKASG
jgi:hypothetical protein